MSPVVPYQYTIYSCPRCNRYLDTRVMGICCMLGSSVHICPRCGNHVDSGRGEWVDLGLSGQLWFITISLIYAGVVAMMGGATSVLLVRVWQGWGPSESSRLEAERGGIIGAIVFAVIVVVIQLLRIGSSLRRTRCEDVVPVRATFWGLHTNWQLKMGVFMYSPAILAGGVALVRWLLR